MLKSKKRIILLIVLLIIIGGGIGIGISKKNSNKNESVVDSKSLKSSWSLEKIEDSNLVCDSVITTLYEDDEYLYTVPDPCYLVNTYVLFEDGTTSSLKEAIEEGKITPDELIEAGAKIYKESKVNIQPVKGTWKLEKISSGKSCAEVITTLYEDDKYLYTVPNPCYIEETFVVYNTGAKYNIKEALSKKLVTVDELIKAGATIYKDAKVSIQPIKETWKLERISSGKSCAEVITTLYEDDKYLYTVPNPCYIEETFVVYNTGAKYNIKDALKKKKVTIDELIASGATIYKDAKVSIQPIKETWKLEKISSGKSCAEVITTLYEDDKYLYTVPNPCYIEETFVVYNTGAKYNIKDALKKKKVTIDELIKAGATIYKDAKVSIQPIKETWKLETISNGNMCIQVITTLYEDDKYLYTVPNPCYIEETFVVYNTGAKYNIKEALEKNKVTIDELINAGAIIYKDGKVHIN